jgi:transglutaminase-like putative cysteine protease
MPTALEAEGMSISSKMAAVGALLLLAGSLACSLPIPVFLETLTPEAEPSATLAPPPTPSQQATGPTILSQTSYEVVQTVTLTNSGSGSADRVTLWVAQIGDLEPYQEVLHQRVEPSGFEVVEDEYSNRYARFEWRDVGPGDDVTAILTYQLRVSELSYDLSQCQGQTPDLFLKPEDFVESDHPTVRSLADELSRGQPNPCRTLEALYDYVREHITYSSYEAGDRGAVWALEQGKGDCTEFADALLALCRAAGIPARFLEGFTYARGDRSDLSQIKHDWLEAYLPGSGWVPLDPTWGRFLDRRDAYLARMSLDHIVVTVGRNPSTLAGYHYFYYKWVGEGVNMSHQEQLEITQTG